MLARGRDVGFICAELYISRNTANAHRRAIYSKLAATPGRGSSTSWRTAWEGSSARGRAAGRAQECGRPRQGAQGPRAGNRPGLLEGPPKHAPLRQEMNGGGTHSRSFSSRPERRHARRKTQISRVQP